jgi:hypothetical protein
MKLNPLTLCAVALVGLTAVSLFVFAPKSEANSGSTGTKAPSVTEAAAVKAIVTATGTVRDSNNAVWSSVLYKDSMLSLLSNAHSLAVIGTQAANKDEANAALTASARLLDIGVGRVDGQAGDNPTAYLNDWTIDSKATATLHGILVQARNEILRVKRN